MSIEPKKTGRPTIYSDELVLEFCCRIAGGRSVDSVTSDADMPSSATVYSWAITNPSFRASLAFARDERLETYASQMRALANRVLEDLDIEPQRVNSAVNALDKAARLQAPKTRHEITGRDGGPLQSLVDHRSISEMSDEELAREVEALLAGVAPGELRARHARK